MTASAETDDDLYEIIEMPYSGNDSEMLKARFHIDTENTENVIQENFSEIKKYAQKIRNNYLRYLSNFDLRDEDAIVDLGFYGNNQKYLNKLLNLSMDGYYFAANISDENPNVKYQNMYPCFQSKNDKSGDKSFVKKHMIYIESLITAPYGMVRAVDENGKFICEEPKKNQKYFADKEEINDGVKAFIRDFINRFNDIDFDEDILTVDMYYGLCFGENVIFSDEVKRSFYNDNGFMNNIESSLFY